MASSPTQKQIEFAHSLGIDIPSGATSAELSKLIDDVLSSQPAAEGNNDARLSNEDELAMRRTYGRGASNASLAQNSKKLQVLKASGIKLGNVVRFYADGSMSNGTGTLKNPQEIGVIVSLDAKWTRVRRFADTTSCCFPTIPDPKTMSLAIELAYRPPSDFASALRICDANGRHPSDVRAYIEDLRPHMDPGHQYRHFHFGEFWYAPTAFELLDRLKPHVKKAAQARAARKSDLRW